MAVIERHGRSARSECRPELLKDFGLKRGAVASSVGHDSRNVIVAGTNEEDMQVALAAIRDAQGGVCVVADGKVVAMVALPIAGLVRQAGHRVAAETQALKEAWTAAAARSYMG